MTQEEINALPDDIEILGDYEKKDVFVNAVKLNIDSSLKYAHIGKVFDWGKNGGNGSAQLALSFLITHLPSRQLAHALYLGFKSSVVDTWPEEDFNVHFNLREWIAGELSDEATGQQKSVD